MILVVLSRPRKFYLSSWAIKKVTDFDASHASIQFHGSGTFADQPLAFEATSHGVGITHGSIWWKRNLAVHSFKAICDEEVVRSSLGRMWEFLGEDYDYKGVGYFAWRLFLKKVFDVNVRTPETEGEMFCSELVTRWYLQLCEALGRPRTDVLPEETSPAGLSRLLEADEAFERVPCESSSSATST